MFARLSTARSRWPGLAIFLVGIIVGGVLVSPVAARVTGADNVVPASTYTRTTSCQGLNFHPIDSDTGYDYDRTLLYRTTTAGSGFFLCDPGLPNKSVVTRVRFTLYDGSFSGEVRLCGLFRAGLATTTAFSYQQLAMVPATGTNATPGTVRLSTTSINYATVDNTRFAYWLQCQVTGPDNSTGVYGADVTYTISAANG
jgi:hypothetical protein